MPIAAPTSGVVEYAAGSESASFVLPMPSGTLPGDVFLVAVTTATSSGSTSQITSPPAGAIAVIPGTSNDALGNGHAALYAWAAPDPVPASITFGLVAARRGSLAWTRSRGVHTSDPIAASTVMAWADRATFTLPSVSPAVADTWSIAGIDMVSGSVTGTIAGFTVVADAVQRNGIVLDGGARAPSGATGTAAGTLGSSIG